MPIQFLLTSVTSNAGDLITLPANAVTAIVGSNNAGKSQLLRDIAGVVHEHDFVPVTISDLAATVPSSESATEATQWLEVNATRSMQQNGNQYWVPNIGGSPVSPGAIVSAGTPSPRRSFPWLGSGAPFFLHNTSAGSLASHATGSAPVGGRAGTSGTNPLGQIYRDGDLEEELRSLARETFGQSLLLDRANSEFRLRVGEVTVPAPPMDHPTREYADAVRRLPALDEQGDGMRSFIGLALLVLARPPKVLLIDEPEAFLHPGQARALGRWLGRAARDRELQIVVATHDRDLLLGLLEAGAPVNVARIVRDGDSTRLAQLPPEEIQTVWADPVLRYSNVLQGLFHRQVVVCESDGDCRFFGAALDELAQESDRRAVADDVLFVPGGGKQRVASITRSLGRLNVKSRAVVDFDVFRERTILRGIVESIGGVWTELVQADYAQMMRPIREANLMEAVKHQGINAVPPGASYVAAERLMRTLAAMGVHIVPVGEMEGFDRTQSLHGAAWVSNALENGTHRSLAVREFVEPLLAI